MDLDAVDIDRVFVERAASHVVLRTQFVGLADAGEGDEQRLDRAAGSIGHDTGNRGVYLVHCALGALQTTHLYLGKQLLVGKELDVDVEHVAQVDNPLLHSRITYHREREHDRVGFVDQEFIIAVFVGRSTNGAISIEYDHIRQFDTHVVLIDHIAIDASVAREERNGQRTKDKGQKTNKYRSNPFCLYSFSAHSKRSLIFQRSVQFFDIGS